MDFKTLKIKWLPCWLCNVYFIFIILFAVKESYYTKPIEETKPQPERSAIVSAHSKTAGTTSSIKGILVTACIHYFVCLNIKFNFFMELHFITKLSSVIVFEGLIFVLHQFWICQTHTAFLCITEVCQHKLCVLFQKINSNPNLSYLEPHL